MQYILCEQTQNMSKGSTQRDVGPEGMSHINTLKKQNLLFVQKSVSKMFLLPEEMGGWLISTYLLLGEQSTQLEPFWEGGSSVVVKRL